jgi:serine O-acetyltransferase
VIEALRADIERYRAASQVSSLRALLNFRGLQATAVYRLGGTLARWWSLPRLHFLLLWPLLPPGLILYALGILLARKGYGIRLDLSAKIGPGLYIGHLGGIRVTNCTLGAHCSIAQQCKIGRPSEPAGPVIGNRVWIGAHARVWGPITVADASTIAGGAYVNRNVASRVLVMGNPARVISNEYDNSQML